MSEECQPSFSSLAVTSYPGMSLSRTRNEMPPWPPSSVVRQAQTRKSARTPLVMKVLLPLTTQPPSVFFAVVLIDATSEPAPGSVIPRAPIFSPLMPGTTQRCRCHSSPNWKTGGIAIEACAFRPAATPPDAPRRDSSSTQIASCRWVPPWPPYSSGNLRPSKPSSPQRLVELARELALVFPLRDVGVRPP